jgi:enoyl-CoA hydratase
VLIVTGAGGHAFCAGADLKAMSNPIGTAPPGSSVTVEGPMGFTRAHSPKPTIAAVEGWCVAGGLEIACWCDVRIASETAKFGCLERRWGVPLIDGGTQRLPRIIGQGRALDLILSARIVEAQEALAIGLANRVVPAGKALEEALGYAEQVAAFPQECVLADRQALYEGSSLPIAQGLEIEATIGRTVIEVAARGAQRFASGAGRGGKIV